MKNWLGWIYERMRRKDLETASIDFSFWEENKVKPLSYVISVWLFYLLSSEFASVQSTDRTYMRPKLLPLQQTYSQQPSGLDSVFFSCLLVEKVQMLPPPILLRS